MKDNSIQYLDNRKISPEEFIDLLKRSTLGERRPIDNLQRIEKMLANASILVTAWDQEKLVGVSRAISDFSFCCYLSDLAVDVAYQKKGIGKELVQRTHRVAGEDCSLTLLAAPAAINYYAKIGMQHFDHCFTISRKSPR